MEFCVQPVLRRWGVGGKLVHTREEFEFGFEGLNDTSSELDIGNEVGIINANFPVKRIPNPDSYTASKPSVRNRPPHRQAPTPPEIVSSYSIPKHLRNHPKNPAPPSRSPSYTYNPSPPFPTYPLPTSSTTIAGRFNFFFKNRQ